MAPLTQTKGKALPPPTERYTVLGWVVKNLLSTWYNVLLTLIAVGITYVVMRGALNWALTSARWAVVPANMRLFLVGQYPSAVEGQTDYIWRLGLCVYLLAAITGLTWGVWVKSRQLVGWALLAVPIILAAIPVVYALLSTAENVSLRGALTTSLDILLIDVIALFSWWMGKWRTKGEQATPRGQDTPVFPLEGRTDAATARMKRFTTALWILYFPVALLLIRGFGPEFLVQEAPLAKIPTRFWGGLLLSLLLTIVGIMFSFPVGVLLALGRQSKLPVLRMLSIIYIEFIRGVPLISLLFMGQVMLNLFIPGDVTLDRVVRAMVPITMFSAAYLAENVRGGLQAIPRGQYEAAYAMGLNGFQTMTFIILPQALRAVIPVLVGQFIGLFKDTTLVAIVGLLDLLGIARGVISNPQYIGTQREVFLFISVFYFVFSYALSYTSRRLEKALGVGER